jgi:Xaa-Pro aminopeptidase
MNLSRFIQPFTPKVYAERRKRLLDRLLKIEDSFICLFWSGSEVVRNHTAHFPFRAQSDFLYLTGFSEPDTLLVLRARGGKTETLLGLRPRDLSPNRGSEVWEGERLGVERAAKAMHLDDAFDIHHADKVLRSLISETRSVFWSVGLYPEWDQKLIQMIADLTRNQRGAPFISSIHDVRIPLHEMRKVKSKEEIEVMRRSGNIAAHGHLRAMATAKPGQYEYQVGAEIEREFKRLGAQAPAYNSIIATGNNACTLHYTANNQQLKAGQLILIDAGAELHGYASDITRTFPVSGRFSPAQREIYEVVLDAQREAIRSAKAGVNITKTHDVATRVLSEGLKHLGIIKNTSAQTIHRKGLFKAYMPHGTSHWLGLDVHDAGRYKRWNEPMKPSELPAGSVITVEPGLYFRADDKTVPAKYRGIGIRIEDDVHVTRSGPDVLTAKCPKTVEEIEAACGPKL